MRSKIYFLSAVFCCVTLSSLSQEKDAVVKKDSLILNTQEQHQALLAAYIDYNKARGNYRIQIISGSLESVNETLKTLDTDFSEWPHSIDFESPSFRLRLGNFKTRLEAEKNLIAVRKKYPAAVLLKPQLIKKE